MQTTLSARALADATDGLAEANHALAHRYPGESGQRQPVHCVYGGAHLFRAGIARKLGGLALESLDRYAPDAAAFARVLSLDPAPAPAIYERVREKLRREPVEDYRIDFEDGYGHRSDAEEDAEAVRCAREVAAAVETGTLPPFIGIRIKPLTEASRGRALRTLDLFLTALLAATGGVLPPGFAVTLPKVAIPEQAAALARVLDAFERAAGLAAGSLRFEIMIEVTQSILNARGESNLPLIHDACAGRCVAAQFGAYDYTAACGITAAHQHMLHPACDFVRSMMQAAFAGTGLRLSDGGTNVLPIPAHREDSATVHRAWKLHYDHIRHSLASGFPQGWDLHPAQLPTRYAAVYAFYLEALDAAAARLRNFTDQAERATRVGNVFDDAATGQGLLNFFRRAINCGAISAAEAGRLTGVALF